MRVKCILSIALALIITLAGCKDEPKQKAEESADEVVDSRKKVLELLKEQGIDIDKRKIMMDEPLKALGIYNIPVKLHPEVEGKIKVWVVRA